MYRYARKKKNAARTKRPLHLPRKQTAHSFPFISTIIDSRSFDIFDDSQIKRLTALQPACMLKIVRLLLTALIPSGEVRASHHSGTCVSLSPFVCGRVVLHTWLSRGKHSRDRWFFWKKTRPTHAHTHTPAHWVEIRIPTGSCLFP